MSPQIPEQLLDEELPIDLDDNTRRLIEGMRDFYAERESRHQRFHMETDVTDGLSDGVFHITESAVAGGRKEALEEILVLDRHGDQIETDVYDELFE